MAANLQNSAAAERLSGNLPYRVSNLQLPPDSSRFTVTTQPQSKATATAWSLHTGGGDGLTPKDQVQTAHRSSTSDDTKACLARSYVSMAKVAVAMAVIRATPKGVRPEEHARHLVGRFRGEQLRWRQSSSRLQQEVLALRQQLLQTQLLDTGGRLQEREDHHHQQQQQQQPPPPTDSLQDGQLPFTQEEEEGDSPLFPTPPCSSAQEVPPPPTTAALTRHAHFLHTFLRLRTLEATPVGVDMKQWEANIRDTVFEAVTLLTDAVQTQTPSLSVHVLKHVTQTLVSFAESDAARALWTPFSEALGHFVQAVLQTVLTDERLNQTEHHEQLCGLVLLVSSSARLRPGVMSLLTHYLTEYGRFLRRVHSRKCELEPHTYESIYHVFHTLEAVVEQDRAARCGVLEEGRVVEQLREQLEKSLLHVSDDFPLFALYVWQLVGVLDGGP